MPVTFIKQLPGEQTRRLVAQRELPAVILGGGTTSARVGGPGRNRALKAHRAISGDEVSCVVPFSAPYTGFGGFGCAAASGGSGRDAWRSACRHAKDRRSVR